MPFGKKQATANVGNPVADNAIIPAKRSPQTRDLSNGPSGKIVPITKPTTTTTATATAIEPENSLSREHTTSPIKDQEMPYKKAKVRAKSTATDGATTEVKQCFECQATETSTWRRDIAGHLICNKCGLRKRKDHKAPSRRLIRKPKTQETEDSAERHDSQASDGTFENLPPLKDPRPPRPWINHADRQPSKSTGFSTLPENLPDSGSPATNRPTCIPSAHIEETSPDLRPVDVPMPRLPGLPLPHQPSFSGNTKSVTPSRRPGPKKALNPLTLEPKVCVSCGVDESPAWRKGPDGRPLCNKCMLRLKRAAQRNSGVGPARMPKTPKSGNITPTDSATATPSGQIAPDRQQALSPARIDPRLVNRTDSQIVLDDFTHLNSSFASDSNRLQPSTSTYKLHGDISNMSEHEYRNRSTAGRPELPKNNSTAAAIDGEKNSGLQVEDQTQTRETLASYASQLSGAANEVAGSRNTNPKTSGEVSSLLGTRIEPFPGEDPENQEVRPNNQQEDALMNASGSATFEAVQNAANDDGNTKPVESSSNLADDTSPATALTVRDSVMT